MAATDTIEGLDESGLDARGVGESGRREPGPVRRPRTRLVQRVADAGGRPAATVGTLALVAATWAVVASARLFPFLTVDNDEAVYLLQADTLRHGRLFPPAPGGGIADALAPWLSAHVGDHYVPKYTPVWPAFLALSHLLTGTDRAAIGVVAAAVIVVTYLLGREVLGSSRRGMAAAGFMLLSPLFLLQSVSFLSYLPNLLLLEAFALALLAGVRLGSRWRLALAGLLAGLALFARPFDAVLVGGPFAVWLVWEHRRSVRALLARTGWIALGATPVVAAVLAFFWAATGSPLRSPFTLTSGSDMPGFGVHRIYDSDPGVVYGPRQAWQGLVGHSLLLSFWAYGGLVLVGLGVLAVARRSSSRERALGVVALTIPLGYLFFWGSFIISRWDGPWHVGPFYYLPVLVPLAILGAKGLARVWAWDRAIAVLAVVAMTAVSGFVLVRALARQAGERAADRVMHEPLRRLTGVDHALVFLPPLSTDHLLAPFVEARNPTLDGKVLWALDHDTDDLAVARQFASRTPYVLTAEAGDDPVLSRLRFVQAASVPLRVSIGADRAGTGDPAGPVAVRVVFGGRVDTFVLAAGGGGAPPADLTVELGAAATTLTGAAPAAHTTSAAGSDDVPSISLLPAADASLATGAARELGWVSLRARVHAGAVEALVPDEPIANGPLSVVAR